MKYLLILLSIGFMISCSDGGEKKDEKKKEDVKLPDACSENSLSIAVDLNDSTEYNEPGFEIKSVFAEEKKGRLTISILNFESDDHFLLDLEEDQVQMKIGLLPVGDHEGALKAGKYFAIGSPEVSEFGSHFYVAKGEESCVYAEGYNDDNATGYFEVLHLSEDHICVMFDITDAFGQNCKGVISCPVDRW